MGKDSILILELIIITMIGAAVYAMFYRGVSWVYVQMIAFLIFAGAFLPLVIEARIRRICIINGKSMVLLGLLAWVMLDPLTMREGIEGFSPMAFFKVFLMIILFLIMLNFGYVIRWPKFFAMFFSKLDYGYSFNRKRLYCLILGTFFIAFLPVLIWGGGLQNVAWILTHGARFMAPWERGRAGGWTNYFKTGAEIFSTIGIQLVWFYTVFIKRNLSLFLLSFLALWLVFNTGTRTKLGIALIPLLLLLYLNLYNKKIKKRYWIFLLAYLLLGAMQIQFLVREAPFGSNIVEIMRESFFGVLKTGPIKYHRDDQFYRLLRVADLVPGTVPYSGEFLILRPFYHFIPRAIWKTKPQGVTWFFERAAAEKGMGLTSFAVSILGEFYLCNGWIGVCVAGLLMGFLAKQLDSLIEMSKRSPAVLLVYVYGLTFLFVSIRSYQVIFAGWYGFIFLYLFLLRARENRQIQWAA